MNAKFHWHYISVWSIASTLTFHKHFNSIRCSVVGKRLDIPNFLGFISLNVLFYH